jgi:adenylate cyclase
VDVCEKVRECTGAFGGVKVGIYSGSFVAGVLGATKYIFDVFGDTGNSIITILTCTVNIASQMCRTGSVDKIQLCGTIYEKLKDNFVLTETTKTITIDNKVCPTFWLKGSRVQKATLQALFDAARTDRNPDIQFEKYTLNI